MEEVYMQMRFAILLSLALLSGCDKQPTQVPAAQPVAIASFDELIKRDNCMACHQSGNQMQLPTWAEVAAKYKGDKNVAVLLRNKILKGGAGAWGNMDMPPYRADLSDAEADVLVQGILATPFSEQPDTTAKK